MRRQEMQKLGFTRVILLGGLLGTLSLSVLVFAVVRLFTGRPLGSELAILFPYLTHPFGWLIGASAGAAVAMSRMDVPKPDEAGKTRDKLLLAGFFGAPFLSYLTGPLLLPALNAVEFICQKSGR